MQSIAQFSNSYKSLTLNGFQNIGRVVIAAVLFGLTIAFSLLVGALCIKLWSPLLTIFVIILYWILVAALLLIGVGFFLGVERVGNETCLYSETFVMSQARTRITDAVTQSIAVNALKYYFNHTLPIDDTAASTIESILKNTLGLTLSKVINFLQVG